jgi:5-methylcytosine-specific restriction endonuclease McrA
MSVYVPVKLRRQIREKFHDRCAYCQSSEALMAVKFEFEHITPLSAGGKSQFENLCLACPTCNRHKSSRESGTDKVTGEQTALFHHPGTHDTESSRTAPRPAILGGI